MGETDLISRQAAIDMIRLYREDEAVDLDELESSIALMPSVQLELIEQIRWERDIAIEQLNELGYSFGEKIRTDSDTISRQAAIDAIESSSEELKRGIIDEDHLFVDWHTGEIVKIIEALPSAQPEIIRCKDCEHRNGDYCHRFHDGYSAFIHHEDYCSYAERRTDE